MKQLDRFILDHVSLHRPAEMIDINEHLKSLPYDMVIYYIEQYFKNYKNFYIEKEESFSKGDRSTTIIRLPEYLRTDLKKRQQLVDRLDEMLWYISYDYGVRDGDWCVVIEPIHTKDMSKYVRSLPYIYHISSKLRTKNDYVSDTIKDIGLRPRGKDWNKGDYRTFTKRVHFIAPASDKELKQMIWELMRQLRISISDLRIFRIKTNKLKYITFYHDSSYINDHYIYAFVNIPWSEMEEISSDFSILK